MDRSERERAAVAAAGLQPIRLIDNRCCEGVKSSISPSKPAAMCRECPHRLRGLDASLQGAEWIPPLPVRSGLVLTCETRERDAIGGRHDAAQLPDLGADQIAAVDEQAGLHAAHRAPGGDGEKALPLGPASAGCADGQQHTGGVSHE